MKAFRLLFLLSLLLASAYPPLFAQNRPNILFLFSDDQRADALGAAGNPYIQTPNLDRLAAQGVRFTNNYCMGSHHGAVCAPSRAMLMSGRNLFRVYDKLAGVTTLPMSLRAAGYETFGTGKWHNERSAFEAGFTHGENIFFGGMSDQYNVPVSDLQPDRTFSEASIKGFSTEIFADAAVRFLERHAKKAPEKPFFAYVSFTVPHDPRSPAQAYRDLYPPEGIPLPPDYMPEHPFDLGVGTIRDEILNAYPRTASDIRNHLADYYGLITQLDEQIGRIIGTLAATGQLENTLIVFTSDHGLGMGSHGLLGKQNLYEHSMKSPLILMGPGMPVNQQRDALVYLYDLFPTLSDLLGLELPAGVEGKSLLPVIQGVRSSVRTSLFTAYATTQRAVRDGRWKLIHYPQLYHTQLFDLQQDPYELRNLAQVQPTQTQRMMTLLKEWQQQTGDTLRLFADKKKEMNYDLRDFVRMPDRHQPESVLRQYFSTEAGVAKLLKGHADLDQLIAPGTEVELLADTFTFTEGPVWMPEGALLFSDIPRNKIYRWQPEKGFSVFRESSHGANGLTLDREGRLLTCEHTSRRVTRTEKNGSLTVLADKYGKKRLNSPNDLVVHTSGAVFFTDPPWGLGDGPKKYDDHPDKELPFNGVFRLRVGKLEAIDEELYRPNGIALSPDEKYLYVADNDFRTLGMGQTNRGRKRWYRYELDAAGNVLKREDYLPTDGRTINPYSAGNPDGMKVDMQGNLYVTGPAGLSMYTAAGTYLGTLLLPEIPTNCAWGDADGKTLYITARQELYRVRMQIAGVRP